MKNREIVSWIFVSVSMIFALSIFFLLCPGFENTAKADNHDDRVIYIIETVEALEENDNPAEDIKMSKVKLSSTTAYSSSSSYTTSNYSYSSAQVSSAAVSSVQVVPSTVNNNYFMVPGPLSQQTGDGHHVMFWMIMSVITMAVLLPLYQKIVNALQKGARRYVYNTNNHR